MQAWLRDLCRRMPKAELHLHLDGALGVKTAIDLAVRQNWNGFPRPQSYSEMYSQMVVTQNLGSQKELLAYFDIPGKLLHTENALRRVTRELLLEKAADNVRYCEIRWAPHLHTGKGLTVTDVVETVLDECRKTTKATGQTFRLIAVGIRTLTAGDNLAMLEAVAPFSGSELAAVDFAGLEARSPDTLEQEAFFRRAKELGFLITLHCGEIPDSVHRLLQAAMELSPLRIAHGACAVHDPSLCALLCERNIMLDLCPTSNIQAGLYHDYESYPLRQLIKAGVPVSISTDDNIISNISLSDEYIRLLEAGQLSLPALWRLNLDALAHAFLPDPQKKCLLNEFTAWAADVPELNGE